MKLLELKDQIIEYFSKSDYVPLSLDSLAKIFNDEKLKLALDELEEEFIIRKNKKGNYDLLTKNNIGVGIIDIKDRGYGFIKELNINNTYYVDKVDKKGSFSGDTVLFAKYKHNDKIDHDLPEAKVLDVLARGVTQLIGQVCQKKRGKLNFRANMAKIQVEVTDFLNAKVNDQVIVQIDKYSPSNIVYGHVVKIVGKINDNDAMYKELAFKYGFDYTFSDEVINDANKLVFEDDSLDYLDKNIFTIDGDDAKDFDDAISIEVLDNGNYLLGVYIADVGYYVIQDSLIDKEAYNRGTSVYLPNHVIPMLPEKLSNDLCSLRENEEKRVIACLMEINKLGEVINYDLKNVIIKSTHRMTYHIVNEILNGNQELQNKYNDIFDNLIAMNNLKNILHEKRVKRGSLDFLDNEIKIDYDGNKIKGISLRDRGDSERMIEEFMIVANETVASHFYHLDLPFIYRIHEEPTIANYKKIVNLLKGLGLKININIHHVSNYDIQKVLDMTNDNPSIQNLILRMMCKAKYSDVNIGHFGLASPIYTHFTSPIRRYPDLIVNRLIHKYIFEKKIDNNTLDECARLCSQASLMSSKKERDATNLEYEAIDRVVAKYYEDLVGYEFEGRISTISSYGLYVTLDNSVEGMVHVSRLPGYFVYDEATSSLVSSNMHHKKYSLGQRVRVVVNSADAASGQIDFIIVK